MPERLKRMHKKFQEMFPELSEKIKSIKEDRNGAGIIIELIDKTELLFSYLDNKTWWLRTK